MPDAYGLVADRVPPVDQRIANVIAEVFNRVLTLARACTRSRGPWQSASTGVIVQEFVPIPQYTPLSPVRRWSLSVSGIY